MKILRCHFYLEIFKVLREMKYCQRWVSGQKQERGQADSHSSFQLVTHLLLEMSDRIARLTSKKKILEAEKCLLALNL